MRQDSQSFIPNVRHPTNTEFKSIHDDSGPSQPVDERTRRRHEDLRHDESGPSQRRREAEEAEPFEHMQPESHIAPIHGRRRGRGCGRLIGVLACLY